MIAAAPRDSRPTVANPSPPAAPRHPRRPPPPLPPPRPAPAPAPPAAPPPPALGPPRAPVAPRRRAAPPADGSAPAARAPPREPPRQFDRRGLRERFAQERRSRVERGQEPLARRARERRHELREPHQRRQVRDRVRAAALLGAGAQDDVRGRRGRALAA